MPNVGFVCSCVEIIDESGKPAAVQSPSYRFFPNDWQESRIDFLRTYFLKHRPIGVPSSVMFRKLLVYPPGFNPKVDFAADIEMWLRLALVSDFYYLDRVLCSCRVHPEGISSAITMKNMFSYRELYELVRSIFRVHLPKHPELVPQVKTLERSAWWNVTAAAVAQMVQADDIEVRKSISRDITHNDPYLINRLLAYIISVTGRLKHQFKPKLIIQAL